MLRRRAAGPSSRLEPRRPCRHGRRSQRYDRSCLLAARWADGTSVAISLVYKALHTTATSNLNQLDDTKQDQQRVPEPRWPESRRGLRTELHVPSLALAQDQGGEREAVAHHCVEFLSFSELHAQIHVPVLAEIRDLVGECEAGTHHCQDISFFHGFYPGATRASLSSMSYLRVE